MLLAIGGKAMGFVIPKHGEIDMTKGKTSILGHFAIVSGGSLMNMIIGVITTPILTRVVDPDAYGQYAIFSLYANIGVMVFCLGMDQTLVRYFYSSDEVAYKRAILQKCILLPMLVSVMGSTIFIALLKFHAIGFDYGLYITFLLGLYIVTQVVNRFSSLLLRLSYFTKMFSSLNVLNKLLFAVFAIVPAFLLKSHYLLIMVWALIVSQIIVTGIAIYRNRAYWFGRGNFTLTPPYAELARYGFPFILSMGVITVFQGVSQFTLKAYCTFEHVGTFAAAMTLIHVFAIFQSSVNALWGPMCIEHYEKQPDEHSFYIKGNSYVTMAMFLFGIMAIALKDLLALFLGVKFREAAYVFPCLIFIPVMYTITETSAIGIGFMKKSHLHVWASVISLVVSIAVNLVLVQQYAEKGAAIASAISYITYFSCKTYFSQRCYPIAFKFGKLYVVSLTVFAYALLNTFANKLSLNIAGAVIAVLVTLVLYRKEVGEALAILSVLLKRNK